MINTKDFRRGNLVLFNHEIRRLDTIGQNSAYIEGNGIEFTQSDKIKPVKLQPHILQMFGFNRVFKGGTAYKYKEYWIYDFEEYGIFSGVGHIELKYAHQLQNLYFAFTGEELVFYSTKP